MSAGRYVAVLRQRPIGFLFTVSLVARLPWGTTNLAGPHASFGLAGSLALLGAAAAWRADRTRPVDPAPAESGPPD